MSNQNIPENNDASNSDVPNNDAHNTEVPQDDTLAVPNSFPYAHTDEQRCALSLAEAQRDLDQSVKAKSNSRSNLPRLTHRDSARKTMKYALSIARQLDETNEDTLNSRAELLHQLGNACIHLERYDEAIDYLVREYRLLRKNSGTEDLPITKAIACSSMAEIVEWVCCLISLCTGLLAIAHMQAYEDYVSFLINCLMVFESDSETEEQARCLKAAGILLELQEHCARFSDDPLKRRVLIVDAVYSDELIL
jgi:tetratricopeptide (TPR) repeat protein